MNISSLTNLFRWFLPVLVFLVFMSVQGLGQVVFTSTYDIDPKSGSRIPFGEPIGVSGKTPGLQSLALTIYYRTEKKTIPISIHPDGSWAGILPALPAKTRVLFQFNELRKASQADKERVGKLLDTTYTRFNEALVAFPFTGTDNARTKKIIDSLFSANIHPDLTLYRTAQRSALDTVIITNFQKFTNDKFSSLITIAATSVLTTNLATKIRGDWNVLKKTGLLDTTVTLSGRSSKPSAWPDIVDTLRSNPMLLDNLKTGTRTNRALQDNLAPLVALADAYTGRLDTLKKSIKPITAFNEDQKNLLVFADNGQIYVSTLSTESLETAEILKYASIDVTGLLFPNANTGNTSPSSSTVAVGAFAGFFFTVSPYIQDFIAWKSHKSKSPGNGYGVAPSVGVALIQVLGDNPKPIYYVGGSVRLSQAFRLSAGWSFFKRDKTDEKFQWMFGFGFSLRVSYLGDLLRLLNATTSEFPVNVPAAL